jgi:hypothetical protein
VSEDFPTAYFSDAAAQASSELVRRGKLAAGDTYLFQVVAFAGNGNGKPAIGLALEVVEEKPLIELAETRLEDLQRRSSPAGIVDADDMPVFIPDRVLAEAAALTHAAEGCETGGILIGRLHRDAALPEIFVEVTAQIPAEHSHPVKKWCAARECTIEKQKNCALSKDFFSEDDRAVMRAAFPRAYSIGLVVNDVACSAPTFSLFGWREGKIHPRGFHLLQEKQNA